jgi:hypothetical protein
MGHNDKLEGMILTWVSGAESNAMYRPGSTSSFSKRAHGPSTVTVVVCQMLGDFSLQSILPKPISIRTSQNMGSDPQKEYNSPVARDQ